MNRIFNWSFSRKPSLFPNCLSQANSIQNQSPRIRAIRQLRQWIRDGQLPAGEPLPPENGLAEKLMVSRTTVRAAVKSIEEEGLVRVADNRRRIVVGNVSRRDSLLSGCVAIITHFGESWPSGVMNPVAKGWERYIQISLVDAIRDAGLHALTLRFDRLQDDQIKMLLADNPRGMVLMRPGLLSSEVLSLGRQLRDMGVPVTCYGYDSRFEFDSVASDHAEGCRKLCDWLIKKGRKRLLRVWTQSTESETPEWRKQRDLGYEAAIRAAGLEVLPPIEIPSLPDTKLQTREDYDMRARLILGYLWEHLSGPQPADAILALTDGECYPISTACRLLGKEPQRDITIVGYDNYWQDSPNRQWESVDPAATIDKLNLDLGRKLMELLLERSSGTLPPEPQARLVTPKLCVIN